MQLTVEIILSVNIPERLIIFWDHSMRCVYIIARFHLLKFKRYIMPENRIQPIHIRRCERAFTLVELLIVIAILAILAAAVVVVLNPAEMMMQARDAERISSVKSIKDSIDIAIVDNPSLSLGNSFVVSVSLPDISPTCANLTGLPVLPTGWNYRCVTATNLRNTDGTGWIPVNLNVIKGGSPIP